MSLRKICFYALLVAVLVGAAVGTLNRHAKEFDVPEIGRSANHPLLVAEFRPRNEDLSAAFPRVQALPIQSLPVQSLPVQSKSARNLSAGKLLVASRDLGDPQFAKTVILLARYDAQGALGLILNRRTNVPLSRALESLKAAKDRSDPIYLGGPMEMAAVFALFQSPARIEGAENLFDGVYMITAKPLFEQTMLARPDPGVFHVYLGYAGWTRDQLRQEVELGAWFIFPAEARAVFNSNPDALWDEMIRKTELQMARVCQSSAENFKRVELPRVFQDR
ncbi:MAG TPA: YqgE/AlgH family protein [Candidatus Sulfotelmatobacter sp.]|jgi:putative transcriptional regulator